MQYLLTTSVARFCNLYYAKYNAVGGPSQFVNVPFLASQPSCKIQCPNKGPIKDNVTKCILVQTCSPNSYRTSTQKITASRLPQYVVALQVAASSSFWHIFRTWCQVTTKLPAQVFVSIQLDLNASWIAHLFIIPLPSL